MADPISLDTYVQETRDKIVEERDAAQAYVEEMRAVLDEFFKQISELSQTDVDVFVEQIKNWELPTFPDWHEYLEEYFDPERPNDRYLGLNFGETPEAPELARLTNDISLGNLPDFTTPPPVLREPNVPDQLEPQEFDKPVLDDIIVPDEPELVFPDLPDINDIIIPDAPDIPELEEFTADPPELDIDLPDAGLQYQEPDYQVWHEQFDPNAYDLATEWKALLKDSLAAAFPQIDFYTDGIDLDTQISNMIKTGLTGLPEDVEQAIMDRAMTSLVDQARLNLVEVDDEYSASGYPMPPGALRAKRARVRRELQDRYEAFKRDFLSKQVELVQANVARLQELAFRAEESDRNFFNAIQNRLLEVAKAAYQLAIAYYNVKVQEFNAQLTAYRTEAEVYELRIRAQLQVLEQYKVVLEGKRIEAEINDLNVRVYTAQLQGVTALVDVYSKQVQAAGILADVQRLKLEQYKAEISAFGALASAKEAEFRAYSAEISGEVAKVQAYAAQVDAYQSRVGAEKIKADVKLAKLGADVEIEKLKVENYKAKIQGYLAHLSAVEALIRKYLGEYEVEGSIYRSEILEKAERTKLAITGAELDMRKALSFKEHQLERTKVELQSSADLMRLRDNLVQGRGDVAANVLASVMNQFHMISDMSTAATQYRDSTGE